MICWQDFPPVALELVLLDEEERLVATLEDERLLVVATDELVATEDDERLELVAVLFRAGQPRTILFTNAPDAVNWLLVHPPVPLAPVTNADAPSALS